MKEAYTGEITVEGRLLATARYFGAWLNNNGRHGIEIRKRKEAEHNGWMAMKGLWSNGQVCQTIKGIVYGSLVRNAFLSGLETVCL